MVRISHSEKYKIPLPPGHRFPIEKYELVMKQLIYRGDASEGQFFSPDFISGEEILLTHEQSYWQRVSTLTLTDKEIRRIGFPRHEMLLMRSMSSASGTVRCAEYALSDGCAMNLAGGTHHSFRDRGEGFCVLNDVALAANVLLEKKLVKKILVVDLDVHQGNGTASIFEDEPDVFTFSMHCEENFPFRKSSSDLDVNIRAGSDDVTYMLYLKRHLPELLDLTQPDIVFYNAGVDVLGTDRLGKLNLSAKGCYDRDNFVIGTIKERNLPLVIVMGGGYSFEYRQLVDAHYHTYKLGLEHYEASTFYFS